MKTTNALILFAGLTLAASTALRGDEHSVLSGKVIDSTGSVVPNATVMLRSGSGLLLREVSGEEGGFRFEGLSHDAYSLSVMSPGFAPYNVEIVGLLGPANIEVRLQVRGISQTAPVPSILPAIERANAERWKAIVLVPIYKYFSPEENKRASSVWDYRKGSYETNWSLARLDREGAPQPVVWQYRISF